ncbi:MAG: 23S rRNA (guanosine(2251)-2'-O)-methyltransferase RlmB [Actinobacteria bacterium HGW-Actinobacteria-7]|nr:MAG: 23S rRNA (guanosine(2251)-2'-O)-methyltransferase RlmB [Actinobacteria bacterium HGW-Actinobacteria-7]
MQIEGRNAVIEALRAGMPLKKVFLAEGTGPDRGLEEIERRARESGLAVVRAGRVELDKMSERGAHQGVIARAAEFGYTPIEHVVGAVEGRPSALIIALDHITDPGNLGAVARTAEVVGAAAIVVQKKRSAAITPAAWKSSAGALAHVPLVQEANLVRALGIFKQEGFWVAGACEDAEQTAWDAPLEGRLVLVMGSEGEGLARLTKEACDFLVSLPQAGKVGSLNVAQATTALAYEWLRREAAGS